MILRKEFYMIHHSKTKCLGNFNRRLHARWQSPVAALQCFFTPSQLQTLLA